MKIEKLRGEGKEKERILKATKKDMELLKKKNAALLKVNKKKLERVVLTRRGQVKAELRKLKSEQQRAKVGEGGRVLSLCSREVDCGSCRIWRSRRLLRRPRMNSVDFGNRTLL